MIQNFIFLYLVVVSTCFVGTEAIVGGALAGSDQLLYQVSLQSNGKHFCGGGIVREDLILSAAHCLVKPNGKFIGAPLSAVAGTTDLNNPGDTAITIPIKRIFIPSAFDTTQTPTYDIAVLKMNRTLSFSRNMNLMKIKIPRAKKHIAEGVKAEISGFGWNSVDFDGVRESNGQSDNRLRFAESVVLIPDDPHCRLQTDDEKQICARVEQQPGITRGVCTGDGGSLLVHNGVSIGILSLSPWGCSETDYGATYVRVAHHAFFLRKVMSSLNRIDRTIRVHDLIHL